MNDVKGLLASKTVWGLIVTVLGIIAPLAGFSFTEADGVAVTGLIEQAISMCGIALALYGRMTAKTAIKGMV